MPHQVTAADTLAADIRFHFQHGVQLVVAGENHRTAVIDKHKFTQDLQQQLPLQYFFPHIMGGVFACHARITGAFVRRTFVERQKAGVLLVQPCGHIGFKFVHGKIHQRALVE